MNKTKSYLIAAGAALALSIACAGSALSQNATITEVVGGLHSPRGLAFGPGGQLYVAQAGDGSADGSIIEIVKPATAHPRVRTVVSGLPTVFVDEGEYVGVDGISVVGHGPSLGIYAIMALSPQAQDNNRAFGSLLKVNRRGQVHSPRRAFAPRPRLATVAGFHREVRECGTHSPARGTRALPGGNAFAR